MNCNHFQLAMLAYNLNCWLMLFNREEEARVATLTHTTLATARLRFLFLAAKIWRHAGRVGISYSDHYAEQGIFRRLMDRLRAIEKEGQRWLAREAFAARSLDRRCSDIVGPNHSSGAENFYALVIPVTAAATVRNLA